MEWEPTFDPQATPEPGSPALAFASGRLLVDEDGWRLPGYGELPAEPGRSWAIGRLAGRLAFAATLPDGVEASTTSLRAVFAGAPSPVSAAAGRAAQVLEWESTHVYCGRCGAETEQHATELARVCPRCGMHYYPRISPAAIMLVEDGERVLLARRAGRQVPFYSVLAGFVEPGETLEQTVRREVLEEVGIEVDDIRYFGSQPWPFPSQLMIGFTARAVGGELRVDPAELADAGWYRPGELPEVPGPFTIARALIDDFVARRSA